MSGKYYITTPIYYVNGEPHVGHLYTTVAADALARYKRMCGYDVMFLTGTDEHGQKVEKSAKEKGKTPIELADELVERYKSLWQVFNISNTHFIRTTEVKHRLTVQELFSILWKKGDIYKGYYEDWYCTPCESFWTENQLLDGKCPDCGRAPEKLREESYFFKLSKYQDLLLRHIDEHPDFIQPVSRKNEVVNFIKTGLRDLSITRTSFDWGIPAPHDPNHTIYVWFDALPNYLSAAGFSGNEEQFFKWWPADVHLIGKDILRFHAVYWPAFLLAGDIPLPKQVFAHGWWTIEGRKMSKSFNNVLDPAVIANEYGPDPLRYFLLREVSFGLDGDFSMHMFVERVNAELANDFGNLVSRVTTMCQKYLDGKFSLLVDRGEYQSFLNIDLNRIIENFHKYMEGFAFSSAIDEICTFTSAVNKFIDHAAPWTLNKEKRFEELEKVLYTSLESIRKISILLYPFIPTSVEKVLSWLHLPENIRSPSISSIFEFPLYCARITKTESLFPRIKLSNN